MTAPGGDPVELGGHDSRVEVLAVLADGRVVSGGGDGRVLVWDPAQPGSGSVEPSGHDGSVMAVAVAVLADGRVVSGRSDGRVMIWNATTQGRVAQLGCSVVGLAAVPASSAEAFLVVAHEGQGFSLWSTKEDNKHSGYRTEHLTKPKENP